MGARQTLTEALRTYSREAESWKSPMYSAFTARMADDVEAGGPTWSLLEQYATKPPDEYYGLRALAGIHRMVLEGELPELRKHYPSEGGDGDAETAWPLVREALAAQTRSSRPCGTRSRPTRRRAAAP